MEKINPNDLENGVKVTESLSNICIMSIYNVNQCKITINIEIVLTSLVVKTMATKANNNFDVEACFM